MSDRVGGSVRWLFLVLLPIALLGCVQSRAFKRDDGSTTYDLCEMTVYLGPKMTAAETRKVLGAPTSLERTVCGSGTPEPWTCQIAKYSIAYQHMRLYFQETDEGLQLSSWECK